MAEILLEAEHVSQSFPITRHFTVHAVQDVSLQIRSGEVFGLVGETGCGKSTLARTLTGIYKPTSGRVLYRGEPVTGKHPSKEALRWRQEEMQIIFQDNAAALNPHMTVRELILEPLRISKGKAAADNAEDLLAQRMKEVSLAPEMAEKRPPELSGGQRQRVAIARSLTAEPCLIVADEPVASLDISIQAQIIMLFQKLQKERGFSLLFIAHDLSVIRYLSDRIGVMVQGKMVELAPTKELFDHPVHPYTKTLLSSMHVPDPLRERSRELIEFQETIPEGGQWTEVSEGHFVLQ